MRTGSIMRREVHTTHDLSDRDSLRIIKDLEPRDYMNASNRGGYRAGHNTCMSASAR